MAGFNLSDYEPVEERLHRAHQANPDLRVITELVAHDDKNVIVKASVFKTGDDLEHARPWATGYAQEAIGSTNITRTSWLEVCETSAIGRALANAGYAPKGARASREEMQKASRPAGKVGGRPGTGKTEARTQDGPTLDPRVQEFLCCMPMISPSSVEAVTSSVDGSVSALTISEW